MKEIVFALCVIVAAAAVFALTLSFPPDLALDEGAGPRFFPQAVAVLLALLGFIFLIGSVKRSAAQKTENTGAGSAGAVALSFAIVVFYAVAIPYVGFAVSTFAFLVAMISSYLSPFAWRRVVVFVLPVAVAITGASYALFGIALRIPLPRGVLF